MSHQALGGQFGKQIPGQDSYVPYRDVGQYISARRPFSHASMQLQGDRVEGGYEVRSGHEPIARYHDDQKRWETAKPGVALDNSTALQPTRTTKKHLELVRKAVRS